MCETDDPDDWSDVMGDGLDTVDETETVTDTTATGGEGEG